MRDYTLNCQLDLTLDISTLHQVLGWVWLVLNTCKEL